MNYKQFKNPLILLIIGTTLVVFSVIFKILHLGVGFFQPDKILLLGGIIEVIAAVYFMVILFKMLKK